MASPSRAAVLGAGLLAAPAALGLFGTSRAGRAFTTGPQAPSAGKHLRAAVVLASGLEGETASAVAEGCSGLLAGGVVGSLAAAVGVAAARRSSRAARRAAKEDLAETIPRPEDLLESPKFPLFMGSTGGYMSKSTRERHAITWTSKDSYNFEMPTGGFAIMNKGENLCYFRKKEMCIALGKQLRKLKIENYKIYRLKADGTVVFMHPADGVFPEKVNKGRVQVNGRPFTVGQNPQPGLLKWTKYHMKSYEADPLTTMFVKARLNAWMDQENLFPLPQPDDLDNEDLMPKGYADQVKALWKSL